MRSLAGRRLPVLAALLWVGTVLPAAPETKADGMRAPKEERRGPAPAGVTLSDPPLLGAMRFFRTTISPVDGDRCAMYPTCSQYGEQAFERHGSILGLLLVVDRLFHEWSEMAKAQTIQVYGTQRFWDPLDANDFWFVSRPEPRSLNAPGEP